LGTEPLTIRPRSGTRSLRKHASLRLEDGAIVATDRRGRSRTFQLEGAENSPVCFGRALVEGGDYWLEDRCGRALLLLEDLDWDGDEFFKFRQASGLEAHGRRQAPRKRPDIFKVMDPPFLSWGIRASGIGGAAVALNWLHIAPEPLVYLVGLPALLFLLWCLLMTKLSSPSAEDLRKLDEDLIALGETWLKPDNERTRRKKKARKRR
jgi:hypothetical protein